MSTTVKRYSEDTANPIALQLGTAAQPQDLTGASAQIVLKDLATGSRNTSSTTTILEPETAGQVEGTWPSGTLVAAKRYAVECVVTIPGEGTRTYPGPDEPALIIEIAQRRT
jgi:hypothetical protein